MYLSERSDVKKHLKNLEIASEYAKTYSGCTKISVGSLLLSREFTIKGANIVLNNLCRDRGCLRIELYGEDSKVHRLPSDCRAIHSEVDVITKAVRLGVSTKNATMYITRYPCEACARTIVNAGINAVIYGRQQEISQQTKEIFAMNNVLVIHIPEFEEEDTTR